MTSHQYGLYAASALAAAGAATYVASDVITKYNQSKSKIESLEGQLGQLNNSLHAMGAKILGKSSVIRSILNTRIKQMQAKQTEVNEALAAARREIASLVDEHEADHERLNSMQEELKRVTHICDEICSEADMQRQEEEASSAADDDDD
jgi:chromosome segregation ATPase